MNLLLWIIQVLLALHTAIGAVWKFANPEQNVASLNVIPHAVWLGMGVIELLCSGGLILPAFYKPLAILAPVAAAFIGAEMVLFSALEISSSNADYGHVVYWLVVAALCAFVAWGRLMLKPF